MLLYKNIKALRKAAHMTQEDLAKLTGYTDRSSIAKIESGLVDLPQTKIQQFADALGTTPSELMGWEENEEQPTNDGELSPEMAALIEKIKQLPPEKVSLLLQVAESIL